MEIKLTFVGDIMSEKIQNELSYIDGKYDYSNMFDKGVMEFFEKSDYVVGNLETPIAGEKLKYSYKEYSFNTPENFLKTLKTIGIDCVTTANNHCLDRGVTGLKNTIDALVRNEIEYTGTKVQKTSDSVLIKTLGNMKVAILSYTYGTNAVFNKQYLKKNEEYMVNLFGPQEREVKNNDYLRRLKRKIEYLNIENCKFTNHRYLKKLKKDIKFAREKSDFVVMNMHSGGQYNEIVDDYTAFLTRFMLNCGVDCIVGGHPHVVHNCYMKNEAFAAFSLGNFSCTPWINNLQKNNLPDYSIVLNLYLDDNIKCIKKITFLLAKSVKDENGFSRVILVDDLISKVSKMQKKDIIKEQNEIISIFTKKKLESIKKEKGEYIYYIK